MCILHTVRHPRPFCPDGTRGRSFGSLAHALPFTVRTPPWQGSTGLSCQHHYTTYDVHGSVQAVAVAGPRRAAGLRLSV